MLYEKPCLSKQVCKKCYADNGWKWTGENENEWNKRETVRCIGYVEHVCAEPISVYINMEHSLEKCSYVFEHEIMCQEEGKDIMTGETYSYEDLNYKFAVANKDKQGYGVPKWTLDCQQKFSFDGQIISIDSRFYPPNYNCDWETKKGGGWGGGSVTVYAGDTLIKKKYFKPKESIDELMKEVEEYVEKLKEKLHGAVKDVLYDFDG